ncbi:tetratricopeptide repeat protein 34 isoform X5 [Takifugu rubripes]|nr:tetratricopeptide repeat protein 34-like isoform X5 [Takifugu rubripes]XP_029688950.1 tetratricopeptide repeat protein 34-like isoform X5 [Takifugu rubripes]XP_029688951.1 tetratricopeptide repeat protein 34-like isoform X5 [Takifugu rubripes]
MMLELTRALACLVSESHSIRGLKLYLKMYKSDKSETVRLVKSRQAQHLPKIVKTLTEKVLHTHHFFEMNEDSTGSTKDKLEDEACSKVIEFLSALSPSSREVQELNAVHLLMTGRFGDSAQVYSSLLELCCSQTSSNSNPDPPERRAALLTGRAAAYLSAGGRSAEVCSDLGEAFQLHPATARVYFQKLFTSRGMGTAARNLLRQQADRGLSGFKERVLVRLDLRSTDGIELLDPAIALLRTLCHLEPNGGGRELRVRLADCLLLRGEHREALSICSQLAASQGQHSYQNTVQVLRGYARFLCDDHKGALEDFQAVIEHNAPHPPSCVRALCGRGLLRMTSGSNYLTAVDYVTASRLQPQETALTVRCLVPWNSRGLLVTVLVEQGRVMLEGAGEQEAKQRASGEFQQHQQEAQLKTPSKVKHRSGSASPAGVHSLALLLMDLQPGADGPQVLAADALYRLGRTEEAYRLLLSVGPAGPRAPILARLALLQLHRGFLYNTNQLLKKLIHCGDTSCLIPLLAVAQQRDRALLQTHCHSAAKRILEASGDEGALREAVTYLSIAIMASGGEAVDSLLERARCYASLGQRKTAIFDFSAILKDHPQHVQALCGRSFTYLMLSQQQECTRDLLAALQVNADVVAKDILALKAGARKLVCDWLHQFCRGSLSDALASASVPCQEEQLRQAFVTCAALMRIDCREPRWHLLHVDILLAKGEDNAAGAHLRQVFGQEPRDAAAQARVGVVEAAQHNYGAAARRLGRLAEKDPSSLETLLTLIPPSQRRAVALAAAQEASGLSSAAQRTRAVSLLTVAVQAADGHRLQHLRQRAACLAQMGSHQLAVADLDAVIQSHGESPPPCSEELGVWVEDLCQRGSSLVFCSREPAALEDFSRALEAHKNRAIQCIDAGLGRVRLAECFLRGALRHYGEQQLQKTWTFLECGLWVDSENVELRRLRSKVKREEASPCSVN